MVCGDTMLSPHSAGLETGQRRIESYEVAIHGWGSLDEYYDQFLQQFVDHKNAMLADAVNLNIELNAVIFADGATASALTMVHSWPTCSRSMCMRNRTGITASSRRSMQVSQWPNLSHQLSDSWTTRAIGCVLGSFFRQRPANIWIHEAAAGAAGWRHRYRDEDIPSLLKQAIRLEPFTVRRF